VATLAELDIGQVSYVKDPAPCPAQPREKINAREKGKEQNMKIH
jgi:hypothetical protein